MIQDLPPGRSDLPILFNCGRLVVRLGYHIQHAAFLFEGSHRIRSRAISRKIVRLARRLEPTAKAGEVLAGFEGRVEKLIAGYRNEWMYDAVASIVAGVNDPESWSEWEDDGEETRRFECERHLHLEIEALASIRSALLDGRDLEGRLALELGATIEQGTRPGDAYLHFFRPDGTAKRQTFRWGPVASYRLGSVKPGEVAPPAGWLGQIRALLRDLGCSPTLIDFIPRQLPAAQGDRHRSVAAMGRAIRNRLARPRESVGQSPLAPTDPAHPGRVSVPRPGILPDLGVSDTPMHADLVSGWRAAGYLGIEIHEEDWKLRRAGRPEVDFGGQRLPWNLILKFIQAGGKLIETSDQIKIWRDHGREDNPPETTRNTQFSRLNALIGPLGVRIVAVVARGRRLEETHQG